MMAARHKIDGKLPEFPVRWPTNSISTLMGSEKATKSDEVRLVGICGKVGVEKMVLQWGR